MTGRGGKRAGAGRKPSPDKLVKMTIRIRQDQQDSLPEKGKNEFIRNAIDEALSAREPIESGNGYWFCGKCYRVHGKRYDATHCCIKKGSENVNKLYV